MHARRRKHIRQTPPESQAAEAATVGWMLAVSTTLVCEVAALAVAAAGRLMEAAGGLEFYSDLLLFCALVTGGVALLAVPVVLKVRRTPPPRAVTIASTFIGVAPWLALAWRMVGPG